MRLVKELVSHPVETLCGLILVAVGIVLTAHGADPKASSLRELIGGGIATAFGGVLLSWTVGKVISKRDALEEMRSQLDLVSRNLGQASGQISRVVEQCQTNDMPAPTGFALVSQSATMIYAQVTAIQNILGNRFDAQDLLYTVTELESLAKKLERKTSVDSEVEGVRNRLEAMRTELVRSGVPAPKRVESVECPYCSRLAKCRIGDSGGETAAVECGNCGKRFNVHRKSDGSLFTRFPGVTSSSVPAGSSDRTGPRQPPMPLPPLRAPCPGCKSEITLTTYDPAIPTKAAVCTDCGGNLRFHLDTRSVEQIGTLIKMSGTVVNRYGSGGTGARPIVECERCSQQLKCIVRKPSGFFAIDHDCGRLYEVTNENFGDWRERHDDQDDNKSSSESLAVPRSDVIDFTIVTPNGSNAAETAS